MKFLLTISLLMSLNVFTFINSVVKPAGWWPFHHFTQDVNIAINSNLALKIRSDKELEMDSTNLTILPYDEAEAWAVGGALLSVVIYAYSNTLW
ncbi:MAG: hypothetical protein K6L76_13605 [Agarilytica sp.]